MVTNEEIARQFEEVARLLEEQDANPFRVQAYRRAAAMLRGLDRPVTEILVQLGAGAVRELPAIGDVLAAAIIEIVALGRLSMVERLRGEADTERLFASTLPGIGKKLAHRIADELGIQTLEDLERAAHANGLHGVVGPKRLAAIKDVLASRFRRRGGAALRSEAPPRVDEVLDVDREYREKAAARRLRRIAPRRFNPAGEAWLPVLHTRRGAREYTAMFSNTALAHRLGRTLDWVVVFHDAGQCTVVTAEHGDMAGLRVVRGREIECLRRYEAQAAV